MSVRRDSGRRRRADVFMITVLLMGAASASGDTVRYVDDDAPPGGDGLAWDTAYTYIQDALADAASDDEVGEIHVAQGRYQPDQDEAGNVTPGDRAATFQLVNGVALMGGYAGIGAPDPDARDTELYETIVTGDLLGDDEPGFENNDENSYHILTAWECWRVATLLEGFHIAGGNADSSQQEDGVGAGVLVEYGRPTIRDCVFTGHVCHWEGGAIRLNDALATVDECRLYANKGPAAGLAMYGGFLVMTDCVFGDPDTQHEGADSVLFGRDGGALITGCQIVNNCNELIGAVQIGPYFKPTFVDCAFTDNVTPTKGAAVHSNSDGDVVMIGCVFSGNEALGGHGEGGAIWAFEARHMLIDCVFTGNQADEEGGAIRVGSLASATMFDCLFTDNEAQLGGAVFVDGAYAYPRPVLIDHCSFENNSGAGAALRIQDHRDIRILDCTVTNNTSGSGGGGISSSHSDPVIMSCEVRQNTAWGSGGGITSATGSKPIVVDCDISDNSAGHDGGGVATFTSSETRLLNCRLVGNTADLAGGGMHADQSEIAVFGCLILGNSAPEAGAAKAEDWSHLALTNCCVAHNAAEDEGDGLVIEGPAAGEAAMILNSILWGNTDSGGDLEAAQIMVEAELPVSVDYNCIQGWTGALGGEGNHGSDPAFVDADGEDGIPGTEDDNLRLDAGSPCIDAANGLAELSCITDLDGNARLHDDPDTEDTGIGDPVVDMGAYEFGAAPVVDCNDNRLEDDCELTIAISPDCNGNHTPDACDIADGSSADCNENAIPDECDIEAGTSEDCNENAIPDECDIADGTSEDCNLNGTADECEADCNMNGVPDDCDVMDETSEDCNENVVPDECDIADGTSLDCDLDGVPDECQWPPVCPADLTDDCVVDEADLHYLLDAWGTSAGDVDGDGDTDVADLLMLLAAWGDCA
jgi:predicted outer membrane repeat protein